MSTFVDADGKRWEIPGGMTADQCREILERQQSKSAPTLHLHVWGKDGTLIDGQEVDGALLADTDVELVDEYDEYWQYGFAMDGKWFEMRIMK